MVIIWSNYDGLESQMLHPKFHENRLAGSGEEDFWVVFTIYGRGGHLGHVTWISQSNFRLPYPWMLHIKFHFDWPSSFREEDLWKVCMDDRQAKVKRWPWPKLITYLHLLHWLFASTTFQASGCNSFQKIHSFHFFPCKSLCFQNWPCRKIGQGHPRVIIWSNYDGLESQMLHTKFHENRPAGSGEEDFWVVFTIYGRGGHLGHVTWISQSNFHLPYPWMLHIKFHFDWPSSFREEDLWKVCMDDRLAKVKRWPWPKLITYLHLLH